MGELTRGRIVVVDGDDEVRRLVRVKLRAAGFVVVEAASLATALAAEGEEPADVVVCEWWLADGTAAALVAEFAAKWGALRPAIVVLSELADDGDIERALAAGVDDVVTKPFSPTELLLRIRVALARRHLAVGNDAPEEIIS